MEPQAHAPDRWQRLSSGSARSFHAYATWLVGISWKRFFVLAILLMVASALLQSLPPFRWTVTETIRDSDSGPPRPPSPPRMKGEKPRAGDTGKEGVDISIDESGIRIPLEAKGVFGAGRSSQQPCQRRGQSTGQRRGRNRHPVAAGPRHPGPQRNTRSGRGGQAGDR